MYTVNIKSTAKNKLDYSIYSTKVELIAVYASWGKLQGEKDKRTGSLGIWQLQSWVRKVRFEKETHTQKEYNLIFYIA